MALPTRYAKRGWKAPSAVSVRARLMAAMRRTAAARLDEGWVLKPRSRPRGFFRVRGAGNAAAGRSEPVRFHPHGNTVSVD